LLLEEAFPWNRSDEIAEADWELPKKKKRNENKEAGVIVKTNL